MALDINQVEFARHKSFSWRMETVGEEQQPVVVIDNFLDGAERLVDYISETGGFLPESGFYPGMRTASPRSYLMALFSFLPPILEQAFGADRDEFAKVESSYSLVTTPTEDLSFIQRIPHFDSNDPGELAMIHFLCGPEHGGTSFYRHRETGFESVDKTRRATFIQSLETAAKEGREPPKAYINGNTELFERVESFDAVFNRLVLYRCTSLHSGNIPADFAFDQNPRTGRLSLNTFLLRG